MLEFRTLGPLGLKTTGHPGNHPLLSHPKSIAVLAYIGSAPARSHRRDTIAAVFWPELDDTRARAALRQLLHAMRRSLGGGVITNVADDALALDSSQIWCDVQAFTEHANGGDARRAVELYRGDFLDGFHLSGSPELDHWMDGERTRLRRLASRSAARLALSLSAGGDYPAALEFARRRVELAPDDEDAHRDLVRLQDAVGDRAGALRTYRALEERLVAEFGCEPAPETRALAAAVRDRMELRWIAPSPPPLRAGERQEDPPTPKLRGRRISVLAAAAAVIIVGTASIALSRGAQTRLSPRRVVVEAFENRTRDSSLDRLGEMAADWVRQGLATTGLVEVADGPLLSTAPTKGRRTVDDVARGAGAGIVVDGRFYEANDSLRFEAMITDARSHRIVRNVAGVVGSREHPERVVETLRQRVMAALATVMDSSLASWAVAASQPPTYEAYQDFAAGMQSYNLLDPKTATFYFQRAAMRDSTYSLPLVFMATTASGLNHCQTADSVAEVLASRRAGLPPLDRDQLEIAVRRCRGDLEGTYLAARRMADELPASDFVLSTLGHYAALAGRPREAIAALRRVDPERGSAQGWPPYYLWLTTALHQLGEHEEELREAQAGRRQYPAEMGSVREEAVALAALGRANELDAVLDSLPAIKPNSFRAPGAILQEVAAELRAHGQPNASRAVVERALDWYASLPAATRDAPSTRFEIARTLYIGDRLRDALDIVRALAEASPDSERFLGLTGTLSLLVHDTTAARAADDHLRSMSRPYLHGATLYWRACISAAAGKRDQAVTQLREAIAQGAALPMPPMSLHADPCFESLHGYPAFDVLQQPKG